MYVFYKKTISHLKEEIKEPESLKELNALIKKKNKLQEDFKNVMKKIKDSSKSSEEQKIYICQIVKLIENVRIYKYSCFQNNIYDTSTSMSGIL